MQEASIRKVTVQVYWKDGASEKDLTVTQYLTNPLRHATARDSQFEL